MLDFPSKRMYHPSLYSSTKILQVRMICSIEKAVVTKLQQFMKTGNVQHKENTGDFLKYF